jgi:sterol desaturase/sphingolipid hydroxylase (fatty acid hydroxylase superfamily)
MSSVASLIVDLFRLSLWLVILAVIFVPIEYLSAPRPRKKRTGRALAEDLGFYFLSGLLPALLLSAPMALVIAVSHRIVPGAYYGWVDGLPLGAKLAAAFVIGEIGFYWGHRWSHEVPLLWRFHAVHHRPEGLDWLINTRAHPIDLVFGRLCGLVPIYLLGLAGRGAGESNLPAIVFVLVGTIWGFFLHANVRWRLGPVEHLLASPRFHHWHHVREGPIDRNYASMLPVMDRLFGTLHLPGKSWPEAYGIKEPQGAVDAKEPARTA